MVVSDGKRVDWRGPGDIKGGEGLPMPGWPSSSYSAQQQFTDRCGCESGGILPNVAGTPGALSWKGRCVGADRSLDDVLYWTAFDLQVSARWLGHLALRWKQQSS
ncbi:hypothetical protein SCLCIDRAFT_1217636 [Scleroderma citrinum Foug A]|uniref:Uncharacterized protein n=1 Tax=Scleroderma citrinum Foug A TaxID=1036808 RepID=A0A0C3DTJ7_9AGAM|nr:hypothetical protein SCLCIDRAFT_1217636 [Scleroderma citrinum Foug A]